jgi:hypothetical protein
MKRLVTAAALASLLASGAAQAMTEDERQNAASDHGYATAALETLCSDVLVISDPKLKAKMDRQYRDSSKYRESYLEGFAYITESKADDATRSRRCPGAVSGVYVKWIKYAPGGLEMLNAKAKQYATTHPEDPNHLLGNALDQIIENVTTQRGETCKRVGNGKVAHCTLFNSNEYRAVYVEMPILEVKSMSPIGRLESSKSRCAEINKNTKDKFVSYISNYVITDNGVVLNCTYRAVEK